MDILLYNGNINETLTATKVDIADYMNVIES